MLDGFVYSDDVPQTHALELIVRKVLTDEAGDFRIRGREFHLTRLLANDLDEDVVFVEEEALQNGNLIGHATRRLEVIGAQNAFCSISNLEFFLFETLDPRFAARSIGSDGEVDDAVLFTPTFGGFGDELFVTKEMLGCFFATKFVDNRLKPVVRAMTVFGHD